MSALLVFGTLISEIIWVPIGLMEKDKFASQTKTRFARFGLLGIYMNEYWICF